MMRQHYKITTDLAYVYKVRSRGPRHGWGWAVATIREWPRGGQIDVQSDFGNYAYSWSAVGDRTLREFLCGLEFDYFMNKAGGAYREFDEEKTIRSIKADIFRMVRTKEVDREEAHEWSRELDECADTNSEHLFAERFMALDWSSRLYDSYPDLKHRDSPQALAFWEGPWAALCTHWRSETQALAA